MTTTCQICGRAIKASKGVIAHHGYTRKGGWQTNSCFGARFRPYEVACDAIQKAIDRAQLFIADRQAWLANHLANPPAQITYDRRHNRGIRFRPELVTVDRPEGFAFETHCRGSYRVDQRYAMQFADLKCQAEQQIKEAGEDVVFMCDRLAKWKAPE